MYPRFLKSERCTTGCCSLSVDGAGLRLEVLSGSIAREGLHKQRETVEWHKTLADDLLAAACSNYSEVVAPDDAAP